MDLIDFQGRWAEVVSRCRAAPLDGTPEARMYLFQALMKLSGWQEAQRELDAMQNENSTWPFALRWLSAQLKEALGHKSDAARELRSLYEETRNKSDDASIPEMSRALWKRRSRCLLFAIIGKHASAGQLQLALCLLNSHLCRNPNDVAAWSQGVRLMALAGDLAGARRLLQKARACVGDTPSDGGNESPEVKRERQEGALALEMDAAMLMLLEGVDGSPRGSLSLETTVSRSTEEMTGLLTRFDVAKDEDEAIAANEDGRESKGAAAVIESMELYGSIPRRRGVRLPSDAAALNNEALVHAYAGNVVGARRMLEAAFREFPYEMLREPFVLNAATLLEAAPGGVDSINVAKAKLTAWVTGAAPDDFDLSCCKQPLRAHRHEAAMGSDT